MRQFSIAHLVALAALVLGGTVAVLAPGRHPRRWVKWASWALAAAIFAGWAGEYAAEIVLGTSFAKKPFGPCRQSQFQSHPVSPSA